MNKMLENVDARNLRVLIIGGIFIAILLLKSWLAPGYFPEPEDQAWSVGAAPLVSGRYGQCDATDDCLFFAQQGMTSQVDVYRHDGTFLYSLEFQDISNGRFYIRCEQDLLYIKLRNNNVFVFQGCDMISGLIEEQADAQGLTNGWFQEGARRLVAQEGELLLLDEAGQVVGPVTVPAQMVLPSDSIDFGPEGNALVVGCCAVFVIGFICYHIFKR